MPARRSRAATRLALQSTELAWAAPQVAAHRIGRMLQAGHRPSREDSAEFRRMGSEKVQAFSEAWLAMCLQSWRLQQQIAMSLWRASWSAWPTVTPWGLLSAGALGIASRGITPLHAAATANLRRLSRRRR